MTQPSLLRPTIKIAGTDGWGYRPDIDGLRAVAVLAVIAYHYFPSSFPGGFIGVDIFFVISGYLITGILARHFETKSFWAELLDFYQRRIRRIFPALSIILIFCLGAGWLLFFASEYESLGKHIAAGAGFVQNIVLWKESGYFDAAAIQKPLLHLWSLAVEEQFYIFWPFVLWLIMRRRWPLMASITIIAGLSFALNVWGISTQRATATFYLPITRAWELMAGAWLAVGHRNQISWMKRWPTYQSWLGASLIALGFSLIRPGEGFPGFWALLPVIGTTLIINAGMGAMPNRRILGFQPVVWVGLISYPLYLWHWVLLSLMVVVFGGLDGPASQGYRFTSMALSFLLAWATYKLIERPIKLRANKNDAIALMVVVAATCVSGLTIYKLKGVPEKSGTLIPKQAALYLKTTDRYPANSECFGLNNNGSISIGKWHCELGDRKSDSWIAAYGDSHALSIIPALDKYGTTHGVKIQFSGISSCLALLGVYKEGDHSACAILAKNAAHMVGKGRPSAIIMIERWNAYNDEFIVTPTIKDQTIEQKNKFHLAKAGLTSTLNYYEPLGIPVFLIKDNPKQPTLLPISALRFQHKNTGNEVNKSAISAIQYEAQQRKINSVLEEVSVKYKNSYLIDLTPAICGDGTCPWMKNGEFLYYDDHHLSTAGAKLIYPLLSKKIDSIFTERALTARSDNQ